MRDLLILGFPSFLLIVALACLSLAAGSPSIVRPVAARVLIMVDESASTRGAQYHDRKLITRLQKQYGARVEAFGRDADETVLPLPDADAVVLFSDGQLDLPAYAPPIYCVIDPSLANTVDASVASLEFRNHEIVAIVKSNSDSAAINFSSNPTRQQEIPKGVTSFSDSLANGTKQVTVRITSEDLWPENNAMTIAKSPPMHVEKWWVGKEAPSNGFRAMDTSQLPADPVSCLTASVIVLRDIQMSSLSQTQVDSIERYIRDLGGTVILVNVDRQPSFSPLSDFPPEPQRRWVILCDQSGSMAQIDGSDDKATRLSRATTAIKTLLPTLPPKDPIDIGGFARDLNWWSSGSSVEQILRNQFSPPAAEPSGPTNLEGILRKLVADPSQNRPSQVLLITDAEAQIADVESLIAAFRSSGTQVHLLQIGANVSPAMDRLISATGGKSLRAGTTTNWTNQLQSLAASALGDRTVARKTTIEFESRSFPASSLRQSWLKQGAALMAHASANGNAYPAIAKWLVGSGTVVAIAADSAELANALAVRHAAPPRDPRLQIAVDQGESVRIRVNAIEDPAFLNGLGLAVRIGDQSPTDLPQIAPGVYEQKLPPPREPAILTILKDGQPVDRIAVAGRYPREFANIGLNRDNLQKMSDRTGGRVIDPSRNDSFEILRKSPRDLSALFLSAAAVLLGGLLVLWKRSGFEHPIKEVQDADSTSPAG